MILVTSLKLPKITIQGFSCITGRFTKIDVAWTVQVDITSCKVHFCRFNCFSNWVQFKLGKCKNRHPNLRTFIFEIEIVRFWVTLSQLSLLLVNFTTSVLKLRSCFQIMFSNVWYYDTVKMQYIMLSKVASLFLFRYITNVMNKSGCTWCYEAEMQGLIRVSQTTFCT